MFKKIVVLLFFVMGLSSCNSGITRQTYNAGPFPLDFAVASFTRYLLSETTKNKNWLLGRKKVAIQQFRFDVTNLVPKSYQLIEELILKTANEFSSEIEVAPLSTETDNPDYLLTGWISYAKKNLYDPNAEKMYFLETSITDIKTGATFANSKIWLLAENLNMDAIADAPVSVKIDTHSKMQKELASSLPGTVHEISDSSLTACKYIAEGNKHLFEGRLDDALNLYNLAIKEPDGERIEVYNNMYSIYKNNNDEPNMRKIFAKLIELSISKNKAMDISFLFEPSTSDLLNKNSVEYEIWLKEVGQFFKQNPGYCFNIIGHTSCTGPNSINCPLSLNRASSIKRYIYNYVSPNAIREVIGKSSKEALVCSKNDEKKGTPDRRVEFELVDCNRPRKVYKDCK